jgi:pyruvate/2-oxoglutarate dehydrogenase complex dihydrolipoamide dehydrogenase (E3) component
MVQRRFGEKLRPIDDGMKRDGAFYLFTLRLIPAFPFFLVNLLMGLTAIRATTFYWVSQIGMLPGTIVYVIAGTQLARIEHLSGIASPGLWLSFALLGVFPWIARGGVRSVQRRHIYARWRPPLRYDRNLVVIGAGAAGLVSAYVAATVRAKVTLIEAHKMGGDCLNYGCVPSKALIRTAKLAHQIREADRYGLERSVPQFTFKTVMARVHAIIRAVEPHDSIERYTKLGVEVLQGHARMLDPWTVEVSLNEGGKHRLTTRSIVIAAGAQPWVPPIPGIEEASYVTSDTLWEKFSELEEPPRRLVVLGGGPIGCELAQCFARLGSKVTQVEMMPRLMTREDAEVSAFVRDGLEREGVVVLTGHKAVRCERTADRQTLVLESDGEQRRIEFDSLLVSVGRSARLEGYGLEEIGIPTKQTIRTNEYLETLYPNIFAAGDVAGPYQFTHAAGHQAWYATVNALFGQISRFKVDYSTMPWTTFVDPEVARVGLNEQEARDRGIRYEVTRYELRELDRAIADSATEGIHQGAHGSGQGPDPRRHVRRRARRRSAYGICARNETWARPQQGSRHHSHLPDSRGSQQVRRRCVEASARAAATSRVDRALSRMASPSPRAQTPARALRARIVTSTARETGPAHSVVRARRATETDAPESPFSHLLRGCTVGAGLMI